MEWLLIVLGLGVMFALMDTGDSGGGDDGTEEPPIGNPNEETVVEGTDGSEILRGGDNTNDQINGRGGSDLLFGEGGEDTLDGGPGDDILNGGADDDTLRGADGDDLLQAGAGNDSLSSGTGDDTLIAGSGDDFLAGNEGDDDLFGMAGNDFLYGGAGNDNMAGGFGIDRLDGGAGDDVLDGATQIGGGEDDLSSYVITGADTDSDVLLGGEGADVLVMGAGDVATGGAGGDTFVVGDWIGEGAPAEVVDFDPVSDALQVGYSATATPAPELTLSPLGDGSGTSVVLNGIEIAQVTGGQDLTADDVELFDRDTTYAPREADEGTEAAAPALGSSSAAT